MLRYVLPLLLATAGCESTEATAFHGSTSFSASERETIEQAQRYVAEHTGADVMPIIWDWDQRDERNWTIYRGPTWTEGALGQANRAYLRIDADRIAPECLFANAAHEWGHQKGLGHLDESEVGIMSPQLNCNARWSEADERLVRW